VEVKTGASYQKKIYEGVPLLFGLANYKDIDTVRITWPNGLIQNEPKQTVLQALNFKESQRLSGSCPMIFAWNGKRFEFITDVLGVAPLQQYMVEFDRPAGMPENEIARLQVLRISWDTRGKRWFHLDPPDVKEKLLNGYKAGKTNYKVHLDGYNLVPYLTGKEKKDPRKEFFYWTDDGNLSGLRYDRWKIVFQEQRAHGLDVWQDPLVTLRFPKLFCLRTDPFERADHEAGDYDHWRVDHAFVLLRHERRSERHSSFLRRAVSRRRAHSHQCTRRPVLAASGAPM
jgi:hypothetical protein